MTRAPTPRRGFVLVAVLVIVGIALLVATSLLFLLQAELASERATLDETRSRALAWSGVEVVLAELDAQRDRILAGESPQLETEYDLFEAGARLGVVRLLPVGPAGERLVPEAAKLDVNRADAETLGAVEMIGPDLADAIIAARDAAGGVFSSVNDLLAVEGVTAELLYGRLDELRPMDAALGRDLGLGGRVAERLGETTPRGLDDLLTVFAAEPNLQRTGVRRIDVSVEWSEELGRRMDRRYGAGAGQLLKGLFDAGERFSRDGQMYDLLIRSGQEPADWPDLDGVTTQGAVILGRLDVNTAPVDVLAALPEITPEAALEIVRARDGLDREQRDDPAWPAVEGIVEPEAYRTLADRLTTRSWTWRVRIAAGEIESAGDPDGSLASPVIYDVVVDLVDPGARVAYVRDVTLLQTAAGLVASDDAEGAAEVRDRPDRLDPREIRDSDVAEDEPDPADTDLEDQVFPDEEGLPTFGDFDLSGDDREDETPEIGPETGARDDTRGERDADGRRSTSERAGPPPRREGRRLGRWWSARNSGAGGR